MKVFIGSSSEARDNKNKYLENITKIVEDCGLTPIPWDTLDCFKPGYYTLEALEKLATEVDAAIFICSADDEMILYKIKKTKTKIQKTKTIVQKTRDNVIFEHGLFLAKLGRKKSIIVKYDDVSLPTDIQGVTYVDFSEKDKRQKKTGKEKLKLILEEWKKDPPKNNIERYLSMKDSVLIDDKFQFNHENLFDDDDLNKINDFKKSPEEQFETIDTIWTEQVELLKKDSQRLMFIYERLVFLPYFPSYDTWLGTAMEAIENKDSCEYKIIASIKEYQEVVNQGKNNLPPYKKVADDLIRFKEELLTKSHIKKKSSDKNNSLIETYLNNYIGLACNFTATKFTKDNRLNKAKKYLKHSIEALERCKAIEKALNSHLWKGYIAYNLARVYRLQKDVFQIDKQEFENYMKEAFYVRNRLLTMRKMPHVLEYAFKAEYLLPLDYAIKYKFFVTNKEKTEAVEKYNKIYDSLTHPKIPSIPIVEYVKNNCKRK